MTELKKFIERKINDEVDLYLYSERGKLDLLYYFYLTSIEKLNAFLKECINPTGNLLDKIGKCNHFKVLSEFSLGNKGFGSPDGCIITDTGYVIFIEGKNIAFEKSFKYPDENIKGFNSSINGQIELKWRFMQALKRRNSDSITEMNIELPEVYEESDIFYSNRNDYNNKGKEKAHRRIHDKDLIFDIDKLFNDCTLEKIFFVAATADDKFPDFISKIRLFNDNMKDKDPGDNDKGIGKVFHFNINNILKMCKQSTYKK